MIEKEINLLGIFNMTHLCLTESIKNKKIVIMEAITEEEEQRIDKSKDYYGSIRYNKNNLVIDSKDIYLYGEVNLNDENDINFIKRFYLINPETSFIYSNFDYDRGVYTTVNLKPRWCTTFDAIKWFKYNHCLIGKPNRIIIYRIDKNKLKDIICQ